MTGFTSTCVRERFFNALGGKPGYQGRWADESHRLGSGFLRLRDAYQFRYEWDRSGRSCRFGLWELRKLDSVAQLPSDLKWVEDNQEVYVTMSQNDWNHYLIENGLDFNSNPWFDPNNGPQKTTTNANPVLAQAMSFAGPPPVYTPSYHTYVVRTADGKHYFKIQIISWYDANVEIGDEGGRLSYYCDELQP